MWVSFVASFSDMLACTIREERVRLAKESLKRGRTEQTHHVLPDLAILESLGLSLDQDLRQIRRDSGSLASVMESWGRGVVEDIGNNTDWDPLYDRLEDYGLGRRSLEEIHAGEVDSRLLSHTTNNKDTHANVAKAARRAGSFPSRHSN